jgi:hypothetical protein
MRAVQHRFDPDLRNPHHFAAKKRSVIFREAYVVISVKSLFLLSS